MNPGEEKKKEEDKRANLSKWKVRNLQSFQTSLVKKIT